MGVSVRHRLTVAMTAAAGALLLAGCGATENGPVIEAPPTANLEVVGGASSLSELQSLLNSELAQAGSTPSDGEGTQILAEVNDLTNDQSLLTAERIDALQTLGHSLVVKYETTLSGLSSDVGGSGLTSAQQRSVQAMIANAQQQLESLDTTIAGATLVDQLRSEVLSIEPSPRVDGLITPAVHTALAAGALETAAETLTTRLNNLSGRVSQSNTNAGAEQGLQQSAASEIQRMYATANQAVATLTELTPAGYPGNAAALTVVKTNLSNSQNGAEAAVNQDLTALSTCLSDDQSNTAC